MANPHPSLLEPETLRAAIRGMGFEAVRFVDLTADHNPGREVLDRWLAAGHQADMGWIERARDKRHDPTLVHPAARSLIMLGVNYNPAGAVEPPAGQPIWARYAQYEDYHDTIKSGLVAVGAWLEAHAGLGPRDYRYYVDTGPLLERGWAERAGLGFIGKNGMLISRDYGNWLFLAGILTPLALPSDAPLGGRGGVGSLCGKCSRCLDACPTNALPSPGVVDARRCISYQTIENRGIIPRELRPGIGDRVYGCDICAEICPWNRFAQASRSVLLSPRPALRDLSLAELLALTPERFAEVFRRTAIKRIKLAGILRNACIVAGNLGDAQHGPALAALCRHDSPIVRAHAVWALAKVWPGAKCGVVWQQMRETETDANVCAELAAITP